MQFPRISDAEWLEVAHAWFNDENGLPSPGHDPKLADAISMTSFEDGIPTVEPDEEKRMKTLDVAELLELTVIGTPTSGTAIAKAE